MGDFCHAQTKSVPGSSTNYLKLYKRADRIYRDGELIVTHRDYSEEKEAQLNRLALEAFRSLIGKMETEKAIDDSIAFFSYFKCGVLEHYFERYAIAGTDYRKALELKARLPSLADSFLFKPYMYLGIILYYDNQYDSALVLYKKAEQIAESYPAPLSESERLYNTLGVLYHEMGNYRQARNYLEKSIAALPKTHLYYRELLVNYKINLASILTKLEAYDEANSIYREILPLGINQNIILHNLGVINLNLGSIRAAIRYFNRVHYTDSRINRLYNDYALAYYNLNHFDSSMYYLKLVEKKIPRGDHSVVYGQTLKLWGDVLVAENLPREAITKYHEAISCFYPDYTEKDDLENPSVFSGIFSYIQLFNTLTAKADAFRELAGSDTSMQYLEGALNSYRSAFKLADYVEKSYDSDEARLFLNRIKYGVHSKPIEICLALYNRTGREEYLEEAWQFDQQNKASLLSLNVAETEWKESFGGNQVLKKEDEIRKTITRLSLRATQVSANDELNKIKSSIRDNEMELGKILEGRAEERKITGQDIRTIPAAGLLRKKYLNRNTALLSYHLGENSLLILCLTRENIIYKKMKTSPDFYTLIAGWTDMLRGEYSEEKYTGTGTAVNLYSLLIKPVFHAISSKNRLIIIPDDELNYIPFEALMDEKGNYLVEKFAVQYQYTASLLVSKGEAKAGDGSTLAFAPFADSGRGSYGRLPESGKEISDLNGPEFTNSNATKVNFIRNAGKYPVIHLATHAFADDRDPFRSYIAFYNEEGTEALSSKLYAGEIYNLNLDSTWLIILSACESGGGRLVHGEGLMSISRAFRYAGCPNIVTSLWKAEDKTTAMITRSFHKYLRKGKTIDRALQLAKLDLLNDKKLDPAFKSPAYWAHLVYIGSYDRTHSFHYLKWIILLITLMIIVFFILRKSKAAHFQNSL